MIAIIIGVVLFAVSGGLMYYRKTTLEKVMNIKYHETTTANDVHDTYASIAESLGTGNYSEIVELSGVCNTDSPLVAEHSRQKVVYFKATISREYETQVQETDSNGNTRWVTRRSTETVSENEQSVPFYIDDNSGKTIRVEMNGADKYTQQSVNRFERDISEDYMRLHQGTSWGDQIMSFVSNTNYNQSNTLGYRFVEEIIPLGVRLYVLGEASDRNGELAVLKPRDKEKTFIVSVKSETELLESIEGNAKYSLWGAIAAGVIGIGTILYGILVNK
jgi:E3 Ubiquitin ligase